MAKLKPCLPKVTVKDVGFFFTHGTQGPPAPFTPRPPVSPRVCWESLLASVDNVDLVWYMYQCSIMNMYYVYYIDIKYTWNPNNPCFDWKRPCFGGLTFKNRGHLGSRYIYIYVHIVCKYIFTPLLRMFTYLSRWRSCFHPFLNSGRRSRPWANRTCFPCGTGGNERCVEYMRLRGSLVTKYEVGKWPHNWRLVSEGI